MSRLEQFNQEKEELQLLLENNQKESLKGVNLIDDSSYIEPITNEQMEQSQFDAMRQFLKDRYNRIHASSNPDDYLNSIYLDSESEWNLEQWNQYFSTNLPTSLKNRITDFIDNSIQLGIEFGGKRKTKIKTKRNRNRTRRRFRKG
jgi:hypothetical protein